MCVGLCCCAVYQLFKIFNVVFYFTFGHVYNISRNICTIIGCTCFDKPKPPVSDSVMESNVVYCTYRVINQYDVDENSENDVENNIENNIEFSEKSNLIDKSSNNLHSNLPNLNTKLNTSQLSNNTITENKLIESIL
jgi:hypothetical protein